MKRIKDTRDIRVNMYGKTGHAFFIRPPEGQKEITIYGRANFHKKLDEVIDSILAQRHKI